MYRFITPRHKAAAQRLIRYWLAHGVVAIPEPEESNVMKYTAPLLDLTPHEQKYDDHVARFYPRAPQ